jgi:hypothetical protein
MREAIVQRPPELFVWKPGVTAWDFLQPLLTPVNIRLFCDELRVWRLIDPAEYDVPGYVTVNPGNAPAGTDRITREDAEVYAPGFDIRYRWEYAPGLPQVAYDVAGTPEKVVTFEYRRPFPGPGAAAAILARRSGTGRVQAVTTLANWSTTPGMYARITLPLSPEQDGKVSRVRFSLGDDALMDVGTRGLIDIPDGSWLDWDADEAWQDVGDSVTWASLP